MVVRSLFHFQLRCVAHNTSKPQGHYNIISGFPFLASILPYLPHMHVQLRGNLKVISSVIVIVVVITNICDFNSRDVGT